MIQIFLMGISSGLPLALVGGTLQAWMKDSGIDIKTIGLFSLVGIPYAWKFIWSPIMDRYNVLPFLGRRRGWMILTQVLLMLSIVALGFQSPANISGLVVFSVLVSFFSASQDIVLDAWRRESLSDIELGLGSSTFVTGYLISFRLISGALGLFLADHMPWSQVYAIMAGVIGLGMLVSFVSAEPQVESPPPKSLREAVVEPFLDFFGRKGAWFILAFILLYKIGDNMALTMTTPMYLDLGFTKSEIAGVTKIFGWGAMALGGLVGGALILRLNIYRSLILFGILQAVATLGFAGLALAGKSTPWLMGAIGFENLAIGMGTSAFVAYMASLTNKKFTATQYALLTSLMAIPRQVVGASTGYLASWLGWTGFFVLCAVVALPGVLMVGRLKKFSDHDHEAVNS